MAKGGAGQVRAGGAYVEIGGTDDKLRAALDRARARLNAFGANLQRIGLQMAAAGVAITLPFVYAAKAFARFDDATRTVAAVAGATDRLGEFADMARRLGRETNFTATSVADMMVSLARAGFDPSQLEQMSRATLALARASGTDVEASGNIMASTIRQFGFEAEEATRVADVLSATANKTSTSVYDLGEALKYAGPEAQKIGSSLEDTLAVLGVLGNAGIKGTMAGTAFRRISNILAARGDELMQNFGVEMADANGKLRPMTAILDEMVKSMAGLGSAEKTAKFADFFGLLGTTGAGILGRTTDETRELAAALLDAGGSAKKTAKFMDSGVGGALRKFWSTAHDVILSVGGALAPALDTMARAFANLGPAVSGFVSANSTLFVVMAAAAGGLIAAGVALVAFGTAAKVAAIGVGLLTAALHLVGLSALALSTPLGMASVAAALLTANWTLSTETGKRFGREVAAAFSDLAGVARTAWGGITDSIRGGDLELAAEIATSALEATWRRVVMAMTDVWNKFKSAFLDSWHDITTEIAKGISGLITGEPGVDAEIDAQARREQADRDRFRKTQGDDARRAFDESRARLDELRARAALLKPEPEDPKPPPRVQPEEGGSVAKKALDELASNTRGAFSGASGAGLFQQVFAAGNSIGEKQLAAANKQLGVQQKILDELKKGGGVFK